MKGLQKTDWNTLLEARKKSLRPVRFVHNISDERNTLDPAAVTDKTRPAVCLRRGTPSLGQFGPVQVPMATWPQPPYIANTDWWLGAMRCLGDLRELPHGLTPMSSSRQSRNLPMLWSPVPLPVVRRLAE